MTRGMRRVISTCTKSVTTDRSSTRADSTRTTSRAPTANSTDATYAGEGAAFAESAITTTEWIIALNQGDYDRAFGELSTPEMRVENRSRAPFPDRSAAELRATFEELSERVATSRTWLSAMHWFSPAWVVVRLEREATGPDREHYQWLRVHVIGFEDGRVASVCQFEIDDLELASAYAEEQARATASRLAVDNRASDAGHAITRAMCATDVDSAVGRYADDFVYDDRRRLGGDPIGDRPAMRAALDRILQQYNRFFLRTLAARGERLYLGVGGWASEAGYETTHLHVQEIDGDGRIIYDGRFDEDDFASAYRELNRRYCAGEGAAFAEAATAMTDYTAAENLGDLDRAFGELTSPDFRVENRSRSVFGDRTAAEFQASRKALGAMVQSWHPAMCWLSPTVGVGRYEREAVGRDGERYVWSLITVVEVRGGRLAATCMFELEDEAAAFEYANERVRASASRLAVTNLAKQTWDAVTRAGRARDVDAMAGYYAEPFDFDDRRGLAGLPIGDVRDAQRRILEQYSEFEERSLAVRGDRLHLGWSRWSNESGFETSYLYVHEVGDDGRFIYEGRFDEDNFEGACRELERRYFAGEGAAFTEAGNTATDYMVAVNRVDFDRVFGELTTPDIRFEDRSRSGFPDRSVAEMRKSTEDVYGMVASVRVWNSAMCWLSPTWIVARQEREAVGREGERYAWVRLVVTEILDGRIASVCEFEIEDEEAAFAYAEERMHATPSRLAVTNRAKQTWDAIDRAGGARDFDGAAAWYSPSLVYVDRRQLSGHPIGDMRTAIERIAEQYSQFEMRSLAVRGDRMHLGWLRWWNDSGYETSSLFVHEVDSDGIIVYQCRFDEDEFNAAYRELERRYCAGEGADFAEVAMLGTEYLIAINEGDFDRVFNELTDPGIRVESRSQRGFPDRSAAEFRASLEELNAMVASSRLWNSAECWLSPNCVISRNEREAIGRDGEKYTWTRIFVFEAADGRGTGLCEFEIEDQEAAFAHAEERVRRAKDQ